MRPTQIQEMRIRKTTLGKRLRACAKFLIPAGRLGTIGLRMRMNDKGRSHIRPNSGMGKPSSKLRLFTNSRIMNGRTETELMSAGVLRSPVVLDRMGHLKIRMVTSPHLQCKQAPNGCELSRPDYLGSPSPTLQQLQWALESPLSPAVRVHSSELIV